LENYRQFRNFHPLHPPLWSKLSLISLRADQRSTPSQAAPDFPPVSFPMKIAIHSHQLQRGTGKCRATMREDWRRAHGTARW